MPADASIYGGLRTPGFGLATLGDIAKARADRDDRKLLQAERVATLDERQQALQQKTKTAQREAERQALVAGAIQRHTANGKLDQESFLSELQASGDTDAYDAVSKSLREAQTAKLAQEKADREADAQEGVWIASQLRDVTPEGYGQRRMEIIAKAPKAADHLPEAYDPQAVEHVINATLSNKDYTDKLNALEDKAQGNLGKTIVNLAMADTPEQVHEAFAMAEGLGVSKRLANSGLTPEAVAAMTPEERQKLLVRVPGLTPNAILEVLKPKADTGGSDYGRFETDFIAAEAAKRGKPVQASTPAERVTIKEAARKSFGQADDAARRPLAPIVIQTSAGPQIVDRGAGTARGITDATGQTVTAAPTTDMRNRQAGRQSAQVVLSSIAELSQKINTGKGALARITGTTERAKAEVNLNDDVSEYEAVVAGFTPLLARALGHTGVLTEQDVQSVRQMLPRPEDSKSVRDRKIARINSIMASMNGEAAGGVGGGGGGGGGGQKIGRFEVEVH